MSSTGGHSKVEPQIPPLPAQMLAIVLPALSGGEIERYGVIPYPLTYAMAFQQTVKAFSSYRPYMNTDNSALRYRMKNLREEFVWADVQPEHWLQLVRPGAEVGLCSSETPFLVGSVFLTYGREIGNSETRWTHSDKDKISREIWIDRPGSFQEANALVRNAIDSTSDPSGFESLLGGKGGKPLRYFYFEKARRRDIRSGWREFPLEAYVQDSLWREVVPRPGTFLGFKLQSDSEDNSPPSYAPPE